MSYFRMGINQRGSESLLIKVLGSILRSIFIYIPNRIKLRKGECFFAYKSSILCRIDKIGMFSEIECSIIEVCGYWKSVRYTTGNTSYQDFDNFIKIPKITFDNIWDKVTESHKALLSLLNSEQTNPVKNGIVSGIFVNRNGVHKIMKIDNKYDEEEKWEDWFVKKYDFSDGFPTSFQKYYTSAECIIEDESYYISRQLFHKVMRHSRNVYRTMVKEIDNLKKQTEKGPKSKSSFACSPWGFY